jgi:hypothetical protein
MADCGRDLPVGENDLQPSLREQLAEGLEIFLDLGESVSVGGVRERSAYRSRLTAAMAN